MAAQQKKRANPHASSVGEALQDFMQASLTKKLSLQQQANRAWYSANGKFEHRHTCGTFIKEQDTPNKPPVLYVYLDSNAIMQDFTTNKDIYVVRLHHAGFEVSDIQFRLSKRPPSTTKETRGNADKNTPRGADVAMQSSYRQQGVPAAESTQNAVSGQDAEKVQHPELASLESMEAFVGKSEVLRAEKLASGVPVEMRENVYRAIIASIARSKIHTS